MSRVVRTSADVAKYYYDFNIQCPILAEPFVSGIEIIVHCNKLWEVD